MSCGSAGNCAAGGYYGCLRATATRGSWPIERNGRWGKAIEVPGLAALNKGGDAAGQLGVVRLGGQLRGRRALRGRRRRQQGFVAVERNGRWGKAIEVPGLAALNTGGDAEVDSVSCASAGNCAAGGYYRPVPAEQGFVASRAERPLGQGDRGARPGGPEQAAGTPRSARCRAHSAGNCAAGGYYSDRSDHDQGFVASERNGVLGHGNRGARPGGPEHGRGRRGLVGVVLTGRHLRGRRVLLQPFRYRYRIHRHPDEIAPSDRLQPRRNQSARIYQATAHLRKIGLMPRNIFIPIFILKDLRGPSLIFRRPVSARSNRR